MKSNGSLLATLNPSSKLLTHLMVMFFLMAISNPIATCIIWLLALVIGFSLGGWNVKYVLKRLVPYLGFFILVVWMMAAFGEGEKTIWEFAWFHVTEESLGHGLTIGLRMLGFVTYGLLFTSTTDLTAFVMSLVQQCKLPPKWAYGCLAGFRFIPLFQYELAQRKKAHKIRGFKDKKSWSVFTSYAFPLFIQGIRKSERIAVAMEARGFTGSRERTYYLEPKLSMYDAMYFIGLLGSSIAIIFLCR